MPRVRKIYNQEPLSKLTMKRDPEALLDRLREMHTSARDMKQDWQRKANRFYKCYSGDQWYYPDTGEPLPLKSWQVSSVRNHVFATINSFAATMTDNRPHIYCVSRKPNDEQLADDMSQTIDYVWQIDIMDSNIVNVLTHSLISGIGFLKTYWDINRKNIGISVVSPSDVFLDPYAPYTNPVQGGKYVIQRFEIDIEEIDRLYPKKIDDIIARGNSSFESIEGSYNTGGRRTRRSPIIEDVNRYIGYEFWIKDYTEIPITYDTPTNEEQKITAPLSSANYMQSEMLGQTQEQTQEKIALFPEGRIITVIGNEIVRDDDENPFKHGRVPLVEFINRYVPHSVWPMGEVEQLEQPQIYINDLLSQILSNVQLIGNNQWVAERGVCDINKLNKEPGLIIPVERGGINRIRKEPGAPLPPGLYQMLVDTEASIQRISGLTDYSTGNRPTSLGHTSGIAIASVQEAAQSPIRMKVRNMEKSLIELGMQVLGLIQQFYEPDQYIALVANGQMTHIQLSEKHLQTEFTIQVESGSTLPVNKIDKANQILNIYDRLLSLSVQNLIPISPDQLSRWLLETINIPGTYPLMALMKQSKQTLQPGQPVQPGQPGQVSGINPASTPSLTQGGVPVSQGSPPQVEQQAGGEDLANLFAQLGLKQPS